MNNFKQIKEGVSFQIKLTPSSSQNKIIGFENNILKVQTTTVPEKGKANESLIKILSKHFKISKSNIEIINGLKTKNKTILIKNTDVEYLKKFL